MELPLFIIPFCTLIADDTSKGTVFVIVFGVNQIPLPAGVLFPQFLLSRSAFAGPFHIFLDAFITRVTKMVTVIYTSVVFSWHCLLFHTCGIPLFLAASWLLTCSNIPELYSDPWILFTVIYCIILVALPQFRQPLFEPCMFVYWKEYLLQS